MIKCLVKEVCYSSSYCETSPLPRSLAKLLAKHLAARCYLEASLCYPSLPSPSHFNFSGSGLALYSCSPKLLHQIFRTADEQRGFSFH